VLRLTCVLGLLHVGASVVGHSCSDVGASCW
jgi:hypothetical protein